MQINMEVIMTSWVAQVHKTYPQSLHNQKLPPRLQDNQINAKLGKAINVIVASFQKIFFSADDDK